MEANVYDYEPPYEMHNGEIVFMASPRPIHLHVQGKIFAIFERYLQGNICKVFCNIDTYLYNKSDKSKNIFQPDVAIICDKTKIKENGIHGTPDLVVEILSPGTFRYDRGYKMNIYAQNGVKEYWIVDADSLSIEVYYNIDYRFELKDVYAIIPEWMLAQMSEERRIQYKYEFQTSIFEDLTIRVRDVFSGVEDFKN